MPSTDESPASPPPVGSRMVGVGDLAMALNTSPATLKRWILSGDIPDGFRADTKAGPKTGGRKWTVETAARLVRRAGRNVPKAWKAPPEVLACGCVRPAFCGICAAAEVL